MFHFTRRLENLKQSTNQKQQIDNFNFYSLKDNFISDIIFYVKPKNLFFSSVVMDVFKKIGALAEFLDDELHKIEASYRIILESSRRYEGPAEIACDFREEIQDLSRQIDSLIVKGENQHEDFQRFLDDMTETIEKFDEKIDKVENYAAKYGYIKRDGKEKIDLRKSLQEVEKQPSGSDEVSL